MALALAGGADLIWLMDDDTVPEPGALRALLAARERYPARPPALVASRVVWTDGRAHPMNTPRSQAVRQPGRTRWRPRPRAACRSVRHRLSRSSSTPAVCRRRGLPQADYFLWNDDFEFTTRLLRGQAGLLCPASIVVHKTRDVRLDRHRPRGALLLRGPEQDLDAQGSARRSRPPSGCCTPARRCAAGPAPLPAHATGARSAPHLSGASPPGCGRDRGQPRRCSRRPARPCQSAAMPAAPAGTRVITAGSWYRQENS